MKKMLCTREKVLKEVLGNINCLQNIYDLLALCCSVLLQFQPDYDYQNNTFCEYFTEAGVLLAEYERNCKQISRKAAIRAMRKSLLDYWGVAGESREFNFDKVYALILEIDDRIPPVVVEGASEQAVIKPYKGLNRQYIDRVCVIPRKVESFLNDPLGKGVFRLQRDEGEGNLDDHLRNYRLLFPQQECVTLYRVAKSSELYEYFHAQRKLRIGLFSVTDLELEDIFELNYGDQNFEVHEMQSHIKPMMLESYRQIFQKLAGERLDFLLFPEMMMTREFLQEVQKWEKEKEVSLISVNGSIWQDQRNWSVVTNLFGKQIFVYYKKTPYKHKIKDKVYWEHLVPFDERKEYPILEIEGFGRIGVAICKDILNPNVLQVHKKLFTNLLLMPAYSHSLDLRSEAKELAEQVGSIVVFANSCSVRRGKDSGGFVCMPAKKNGNRHSELIEYSEKIDNSTDKSICSGKYCFIDLTQIVTYPDKAESFQIEFRDYL